MNFLTLILAHTSFAHAALPIGDELWLPVQKDGMPILEAKEEGLGNQLNLVGDAEHPVGQWWIDDDNLFVRMRLTSDPESDLIVGTLEGNETQYGWGILADTDGALDTYERLVSIDQRGMRLVAEGMPDGPGWTAAPTASFGEIVGPMSSSLASISTAGTTLGDSDNGFIDLAVPISWVGLDIPGATIRIALVTDLNRISPGFEYDIAAFGPAPTLEDSFSDPIGIDPDEDGLGLDEERALGTDPQRADTDGDGFSDGDEALIFGTDPLDEDDPDPAIDIDCDGIPDEIEPDSVEIDSDPDEDGLTSAEEIVCGSDPCLYEEDIDGDGIPNEAEAACGGDPCLYEEDIDGDGISSLTEISEGTDPCAAPTTGDTGSSDDTGSSVDTGIGDDSGTADGTPPIEDEDCDGIPDHEDENVDFIDDEDNDGDGISNEQELNACGTDPCTYDMDPDNDGVSNERERVCETNPCRPDTDADGRWDNEELSEDGCGPDSDGDGIPDALDPDGPISDDPVQPETGTYGFSGGSFTGGGCSHTPRPASLMWIFICMLIVGRRSSVAAALMLFAFTTHTANAQSVDANRFIPSPHSQTFVSLEDPIVSQPGFSAGLFFHHAKNPLLYRIDDPSREDIRVVGNLWSADFISGYRFGKWDVALHLPTHVYAEGDAFKQWGSIGDVAIQSGITLLDRRHDPVGLGVTGRMSAPTGKSLHWLGGSTYSGSTNAHLSYGTKMVVAANVGAHIAKAQDLGDLQTGPQLRWGAGGHAPLSDRTATSIEINGAHNWKSFNSTGAHPIELLNSGQWTFAEKWQFNIGWGTALSRGIGAPAYRLLAGLRYGPQPETTSTKEPTPRHIPRQMISLSVTNHEGQPVQTRAILVESAIALDTDSAGNVERAVDSGAHTLRINQPGYAPIQRILEIPAGQTVNLAVVISPSRVEVSEDQILIQDRIFFESGSAAIEATSNSLLDEVAMVILDDPSLLIVEVQGHTDNTGNEEKNRQLSQERAEAVRAYLEYAGVTSDRLQAKGFGESKPLSTDDTEDARMTNRRVEFHVLKRGTP